MNNKTALITGATSGIGLEIVQTLSKLGFNLILLGRNEEKLRSVANGLNCDSKIYVCDLAKEIPDIKEDVDILINNAGIADYNSVTAMSIEQFDNVMNVNLRAAFILIKIALPNMIKKSFGRIVNIGSNLSMQPCATLAHYTTSKAGLLGLSRSVAAEVARYNITCNVISPGYIKTPMHKVNFDQNIEAQLVNNFGLPIRRL